MKHRSYPVKEWGGFVWAWLGDKEDMPEFQPPAFAPREDSAIAILKIRIPANWAQIHEGQIDSAHALNVQYLSTFKGANAAELGAASALGARAALYVVKRPLEVRNYSILDQAAVRHLENVPEHAMLFRMQFCASR